MSTPNFQLPTPKESTEEGVRRIAIIGHGLIGGSIALVLRRVETPPEVIALDRDDDLAQASGADIIFLCAPISQNIRILRDLPSKIAGGTIVTDTGSTKRTIVAAAEALPPRLAFVGGHPMSGAAAGGIAGATATLFEKRPWILTTTRETNRESLNALRRLIESFGAFVRVMDPAEHDRLVAHVSHLPQLVVSALMQVVGNATGPDELGLAGPGLRDSTRLAASPPAMWSDILESNADAINPALDSMIAALEQLRDHGHEVLPEIFTAAAHWKQVLDRGNVE